MKTVCDRNMCTGCMACVESCPKKAIQIEDSVAAYNAVIQEEKCSECGLCHKMCPQNTKVPAGSPILWYQGWATEPQLRSRASSGGLAGAIVAGFVQAGGSVCSCRFENGRFSFAFAETEKDLLQFAGSKYVKSDPFGIYQETKSRLKAGQRVLFVGLPCQAAALINYIPESLRQNLYTMDLICHGTPSPKILEAYLKQKRMQLSQLREIQFRRKGKFQIYADGQPVEMAGVRDSYMMAFLNSSCYTENCYHCRYASLDRVSDLTVGDSWGSDLPADEQKKGLSLCLCQTEKGKQLLEMASLHLEAVDLNKAVQNNQQLKRPSEKHKGYEGLINAVRKGTNFDAAVFCGCPKQYFKQMIKKVLIRCGLWKG